MSDFYNMNMSVKEILESHPRANEVLGAFQLGGCGFCQLASEHNIGDICQSYGIDPDQLFEALEVLRSNDD